MPRISFKFFVCDLHLQYCQCYHIVMIILPCYAMLLVTFDKCQIANKTIDHKDKKYCNSVIIYNPQPRQMRSTYVVLGNIFTQRIRHTHFNCRILDIESIVYLFC